MKQHESQTGRWAWQNVDDMSATSGPRLPIELKGVGTLALSVGNDKHTSRFAALSRWRTDPTPVSATKPDGNKVRDDLRGFDRRSRLPVRYVT